MVSSKWMVTGVLVCCFFPKGAQEKGGVVCVCVCGAGGGSGVKLGQAEAGLA